MANSTSQSSWYAIARMHETNRPDYAITSVAGLKDGKGHPIRPCFSVWQMELKPTKFSTAQDKRFVHVVPVMSAKSFEEKCKKKYKDPENKKLADLEPLAWRPVKYVINGSAVGKGSITSPVPNDWVPNGREVITIYATLDPAEEEEPKVYGGAYIWARDAGDALASMAWEKKLPAYGRLTLTPPQMNELRKGWKSLPQ